MVTIFVSNYVHNDVYIVFFHIHKHIVNRICQVYSIFADSKFGSNTSLTVVVPLVHIIRDIRYMLSVNVIHIEELALSGAQSVADEETWIIRMMHPLLTEPHTHV